MINKITDKATTTTQPTNFFVNLAGAVKQLSWAGFKALLDALYAPITHTHAQSDVTGLTADLAAKAPLASPALTGTPTAPTAATTTNTTQIASTAFVQQEIAALVDSSPSALNTLNELAAALGDDANYAATVTSALAGKASTTHASEHEAGGSDALKLDDLAAPDDNTDLDASALKHGLMSKADKTKLDGVEAGADVTDAANVAAAIDASTYDEAPWEENNRVPYVNGFGGSAVLKHNSWSNIFAQIVTYLNGVSFVQGKALDTLAACSDVTDLNATASAHGLLPKLSGSATDVLRGDGTFGAVPGGGGGASISLALRAWVETAANGGSDGTGAVGDPSKPYETMLAAYTAGARLIHLGAGTHAGVTKTGDIDFCFTGHGREKTTITAIVSTTGGAISVQDLGFKSAEIVTLGTNWSGASLSPGANGANAGAMFLSNLYVSGSVGSNGQTGADGDSGTMNGGAGGTGPTVTGNDLEIGGSLDVVGGGGGSPFDDAMTPADGGAGGSAGSITIKGTLRVGSNVFIYASGGNSGVNSGMDGSPGNGGSLNADDLYIGASLSANAAGDASYPGTLQARKAWIYEASFDGSIGNFGSIEGSFIIITILTGSPETATLLMSYLNGAPVGTT